MHRKLLILLTLVALGPADARATPPQEATRQWQLHQPFLRKLDGAVRELHKVATSKGYTPGRLRGMSPVQLTGSSVYKLPASARLGRLPELVDVDMRVVGVSVDELKASLAKSFPEVDPGRDVHVEPSYHGGITHVQVKLKDRQLDISLYAGAPEFNEPHQRLSMAALKLNLAPDRPLERLLPRLTDPKQARALRDERVLVDPAGHGLEDARRGIIRAYHVPGMDPVRAPEGLLHALYWTAKVKDGVTVEPETLREFAALSPRALGEFFEAKAPEVAARRRNYLFSILRVKPGRDPLKALDLYEESGALGKIFPGMEAVVAEPVRWARTRETVAKAFKLQLRKTHGKDERRAREVMMGALLSELPDAEAARRALAGFHWAEAPEAGDYSLERIIGAYERFHTAATETPAPARVLAAGAGR